jgi:FeS assembly SUF system protein
MPMEGKPLENDVKADTAADVKPAAPEPVVPVAEPSAAPEAAAQEIGPNVPAIAASSIPQEELDRLTADITAALKTVFDPEIPSDIYELGLIYRVDISDDREVAVDMTLTAPGCPVAGEMPTWVENAVNAVPGVKGTKVTLTFDPPWDQSRMSDEARLALNMF